MGILTLIVILPLVGFVFRKWNIWSAREILRGGTPVYRRQALGVFGVFSPEDRPIPDIRRVFLRSSPAEPRLRQSWQARCLRSPIGLMAGEAKQKHKQKQTMKQTSALLVPAAGRNAKSIFRLSREPKQQLMPLMSVNICDQTWAIGGGRGLRTVSLADWATVEFAVLVGRQRMDRQASRLGEPAEQQLVPALPVVEKNDNLVIP